VSSTYVIAIDGTSASGKGTLSSNLAKHYGFDYLDTGKIYRTLGWYVLKQGVDLSNIEDISSCIKSIDFSKDIPGNIEGEDIGSMASKLGAIPEVRELLNQEQKDFAIGKIGVVVDGRDIGTVIFPNADFKLFVTADQEIRAKRRFKQLQNKGKNVIYDDVLRDIRERDERDSTREVAPLKPARDAIKLDTSQLDADSVLELVIALTQKFVSGRNKAS
jgi:cytidylate kinase